jgi:tetratricopeptide (TPR) repeat protein
MEVLIAIDRDEPSPPRSVNPTISAELDGIIVWCLSKQPPARPTARTLVDALELRRPNAVIEAAKRGSESAAAKPGLADGKAMDLCLRARQDMRRLWHTLDLSAPIALLEAALALAPDVPLILATYAAALARQSSSAPGILPHARLAANRALDVAPHLGEAWLARAIVHSQRLEYVAEASTLARGIAVAPSVAQLHWRAGHLLLQTGPIAAAERSLERARLVDPYDGEVIAGLARAAAFRGDTAGCDRLMATRCDSGLIGLDLQRARVALWRRSRELAEPLAFEAAAEEIRALTICFAMREVALTLVMPEVVRGAMRVGSDRAGAGPPTIYYWQLIAEMEACAGEHERAQEALEMAADAGCTDIVNLDHLELYEPLRTTPRWRALRDVVALRADSVRTAFGVVAAEEP